METPPYDPTVKATPPSAPAAGASESRPTSSATPRSSSSSRPTQPALPKEVEAAGASAQFGNFVRTVKLGAGGMGEVWKAFDTKLNRWVALKFLKGGDEEEILRFEREAQTAGRLTHPHIATIYEVGQDQGRHYIAMQYVEGRTLKGHSRDDLKLIIDLIRDAARAVQYAHEQGIIHRDLKPDNVMVQKRHTYVMDFGLARATEGASGLSISGQVVGTPSYMPPEQARGSRVDARGDVYSLGATLYEVLTGRVPFRGENVYQTLQMVQEADPVAPRRLNPRIDPELETIVLKCLEKSPERRYATAAEFADDLTRWLKGEPILAHPPSLAYRLRKFAMRRKAVLIPTVLGLVVLVAFFVVNSVRQTRIGRERTASAALLEKQGRLSEARDGYRSALDADRTNSGASEGLVRADAALKRIERERAERERSEQEAFKLFEAGRAPIDMATRFLYKKSAPFDEVLRRVEQGRALIEQGLAKAPHLPLGHHLLGIAWELSGWSDRALASYRRAVELDPKFGPAHFRLGKLLAAESYRAALHSERVEEDAKRDRVRRLAEEAADHFVAATRTGSGLDEPILRQLAEALLAYTRGDLDLTRRAAQEGLDRFKGQDGTEDFHWLIGMGTREPQPRLAAFTRAIEERPRFPEALVCRGLTYSELFDYPAAFADFEEAVKLFPRCADMWIDLGNARFNKGDTLDSLADYDEAIRLDATIPTAYANRAIARMVLKDYEAARRDCAEAIRLDATYAFAWFVRGFTWANEGVPDKAIPEYQEAIRLNPLFVEAHYKLGNAKLDKEDCRGAIPHFDEAIRIQPRHADALANRGGAKQGSGDLKGAAEDYREALRVAPSRWRFRAAVEQRLKEIDR